MDTIFNQNTKAGRTVTRTAGIIIVLSLLIVQNPIILAKDLGIGIYTGISPSIDYIKETQDKEVIKFNKEIQQKYHGNKIV